MMMNFLLAAFSLAEVSAQSIDRRIDGRDPAVSLSRFVGYPKGAEEGYYIPNTNFYLRGVDFSCASPWNSGGGPTRAGTLISKRHIIFAVHFPLWKGVRILFVDEDGAACPCYVEATRQVADSDIMIGLLNAEVTPNIHPAKILPPDIGDYLVEGRGFPTVTFNQKEQALLNYLPSIPTNSHARGMMSYLPNEENRKKFRDWIVGGDSGNPAFLIVGNEPILLYCLKGGGCGSGPAIHQYRCEIQKAMDELCPGYKLESFDFTKVPRGK